MNYWTFSNLNIEDSQATGITFEKPNGNFTLENIQVNMD